MEEGVALHPKWEIVADLEGKPDYRRLHVNGGWQYSWRWPDDLLADVEISEHMTGLTMRLDRAGAPWIRLGKHIVATEDS